MTSELDYKISEMMQARMDDFIRTDMLGLHDWPIENQVEFLKQTSMHILSTMCRDVPIEELVNRDASVYSKTALVYSLTLWQQWRAFHQKGDAYDSGFGEEGE